MEIFLILLMSSVIRGVGYVVSKYISLGKESSHAMALANASIDTLLSLPIGVFFALQNLSSGFNISMLLLSIISAAAYGISVSFQYAALKRIDMSVMGIVLRLNILFSALIGILVLAEKMNGWNYLGLVVILIGNFAVLFKKGRVNINYGVVFAALAALSSAIAGSMDKYILNHISSVLYVSLNSVLIMSTLFLMKPSAGRESLRLIRKRLPIFVLFSLLNIMAWYLASYALQNMDVSKFTPVQKTITLIIPVLSGILIFKEKDNILQKIVGLGLAIIGIALMYVNY
jgi:drug/metabolite transporter (DMT)-like permease